jgi:hypothetical protein
MSAGPPEAVVACAVGHGLVGQAQRGGGKEQGWRQRITASRENVDDDRSRVNALIEGFTAGGLDSLQAVVPHAAQDLDHLAVAIVAAAQFAPDRGHGLWQDPVPERGTIAQRAGFACQNRHIVPRIIDRLTATEGAGMFCDHHSILPDDDPIGIGMHIDRSAHCSCEDGILVGVEAHGAGLGHTRPCSPLVREQWSSGRARCGSRRKDRHRAQAAAAQSRTSPRPSCRSLRDDGAPWHGPRICRAARRSALPGS